MGDGYVHYGPFASFGGRNPKQMHPATCARCNEMTEVPFVPRGDRPVYCSDCFSTMRVSGSVRTTPHATSQN
jgi:CxxC-x17-CxxC domain-containing protein